MVRRRDSGRDPSAAELAEAERVAALHPAQQKTHPSALAADASRLQHINTYGALPEYYIDQPFSCRLCGKREIPARPTLLFYRQRIGLAARSVMSVGLIAGAVMLYYGYTYA